MAPEDHELDQDHEIYRMELESIREENEVLKATIEELQMAYDQLKEEFSECDLKRIRLEIIGRPCQSCFQWILKETNTTQVLLNSFL